MIEVGTQKSYDVQEAAELINLTPKSIRNYIKAGKIRAQKLGTRYYITEENLQSFLRGDSKDYDRKD